METNGPNTVHRDRWFLSQSSSSNPGTSAAETHTASSLSLAVRPLPSAAAIHAHAAHGLSADMMRAKPLASRDQRRSYSVPRRQRRSALSSPHEAPQLSPPPSSRQEESPVAARQSTDKSNSGSGPTCATRTYVPVADGHSAVTPSVRARAAVESEGSRDESLSYSRLPVHLRERAVHRAITVQLAQAARSSSTPSSAARTRTPSTIRRAGQRSTAQACAPDPAPSSSSALPSSSSATAQPQSDATRPVGRSLPPSRSSVGQSEESPQIELDQVRRKLELDEAEDKENYQGSGTRRSGERGRQERPAARPGMRKGKSKGKEEEEEDEEGKSLAAAAPSPAEAVREYHVAFKSKGGSRRSQDRGRRGSMTGGNVSTHSTRRSSLPVSHPRHPNAPTGIPGLREEEGGGPTPTSSFPSYSAAIPTPSTFSPPPKPRLSLPRAAESVSRPHVQKRRNSTPSALASTPKRNSGGGRGEGGESRGGGGEERAGASSSWRFLPLSPESLDDSTESMTDPEPVLRPTSSAQRPKFRGKKGPVAVLQGSRALPAAVQRVMDHQEM